MRVMIIRNQIMNCFQAAVLVTINHGYTGKSLLEVVTTYTTKYSKYNNTSSGQIYSYTLWKPS